MIYVSSAAGVIDMVLNLCTHTFLCSCEKKHFYLLEDVTRIRAEHFQDSEDKAIKHFHIDCYIFSFLKAG